MYRDGANSHYDTENSRLFPLYEEKKPIDNGDIAFLWHQGHHRFFLRYGNDIIFIGNQHNCMINSMVIVYGKFC